MTKIAERAFILMKRHKITQAQVAAEYGCTREYINRILNGLTPASKEVQSKVLEAVERIINDSAR